MFGWRTTKDVEVGHAHERLIGCVVRDKGAIYSCHHGKPYQIFRKLLPELLLLLRFEEFLVSGIANEQFQSLRIATNAAEERRHEWCLVLTYLGTRSGLLPHHKRRSSNAKPHHKRRREQRRTLRTHHRVR